MAFQDVVNELLGQVPGLSVFQAQTFVQRAWRQICDGYRWSFKRLDGAIVCPAQVVAGTVALTQFADTVTADATASAALLAVPSTPGLASLQIRFTGTGTTFQIYSITSVDSTIPTAVVLTLDRTVLEVTNAAATYQAYRCYATAPYSDTKRLISVVDMVNAQPVGTDYTSVDFDRFDPQRQSQGLAYRCGVYQPQADGTLRFEFWPHPTTGQTFYVRIERSGEDLYFEGDDELPTMIPEELVVTRALGYHVYPWAAQNVSLIPSLKGPNWLGLMAAQRPEYRSLFLTARKDDDNLATTSVMDRGHGLRDRGVGVGANGLPIIIDANWMQQHAF